MNYLHDSRKLATDGKHVYYTFHFEDGCVLGFRLLNVGMHETVPVVYSADYEWKRAGFYTVGNATVVTVYAVHTRYDFTVEQHSTLLQEATPVKPVRTRPAQTVVNGWTVAQLNLRDGRRWCAATCAEYLRAGCETFAYGSKTALVAKLKEYGQPTDADRQAERENA